MVLTHIVFGLIFLHTYGFKYKPAAFKEYDVYKYILSIVWLILSARIAKWNKTQWVILSLLWCISAYMIYVWT